MEVTMPGITRSRHSGVLFSELKAWIREHLTGQRSMNSQSTRFENSIEKIEHIGKMSPGWNGFKAAVADASVRHAAISFLQEVGQRFPSDVHEPTIVAPTPDGGVAIEWRLADAPRCFELVFMPHGAREWALREKERTIDYAEDANEAELFDLMKRHVAGHTTIILK